MESAEEIADAVVSAYYSMIQPMDIEAASRGKPPLLLPVLGSEEIILLCEAARDIFSAEDVSLSLTGPILIVGDLHGQILDLFRVLQTYGLPDQNKYLFLGDLVDRGEFSTETCALVWALKVKYRDKVFIIRGNHEFSFLCKQCGFHAEVTTIYGPGSRVFESFIESFSFMPLTAVINEQILCVHGGLGPSWFSLSQSRQVDRPVHEFGEDLLDAMLWSDPNPGIYMFEPSNRGAGYLFGEGALVEFLDSNRLKLLVRAHECVNTGCQFAFNDRLATVFGASNYGGLVSNDSAVLEISESSDHEVRQFPPLTYLKRDTVKFGKLGNDGTIAAPSRQVHPPGRGLHPGVPRLPPLGGNGLPISEPRGAKPLSGRSWGPPVKAPGGAPGCRSPRRVV
jgi:protein phosphatase